MKNNSSANNSLHLLDILSNDFDEPPVISAELIKNIQSMESFNNQGLDLEFDRIYPPRMRAISDIQWSSVRVAQLIAGMIEAKSRARFIDIGSGVGKLCTLLSFLTDLELFGLEQREDLFKISQTVAKQNSLSRVHFLHGNMLELNWSEYDIFYLYNPFQEHTSEISSDIGLIDRNIELDRKYYVQYISEVFRQMTWLEPGKKVIIYHGYGNVMPPSMKLVSSHYIANGHLCLWEKQAGKNIGEKFSDKT